MRILVSGSSGFVGSALVPFLRSKGNQVVRLLRVPSSSPDAIFWNPTVPSKELEGFGAVIHLAAENIGGRWTEEKMRKILESRSIGTQQLAEALAKTKRPPQVFLSPSAIGYYGSRGEEGLSEESLSGVGFFPEVCRNWEMASSTLALRGCRVLHSRFGVVLDWKGGLLRKLLFPTRMFLGGAFGSGKQWISWVSLRDVLRVVEFGLTESRLSGAFNVVAPEPIRQRDFACRLARRLHRKAFAFYPSGLLRLLFGRMADEVLLASAKVESKKVSELGFVFEDGSIDSVLQDSIK